MLKISSGRRKRIKKDWGKIDKSEAKVEHICLDSGL